MEKELGGQRLGSESKMDVQMHNYERSTHDLSYLWRSSMAAGTLVPFMSKVALNGDKFKINLKTLIRTMPTNGPLFGSFKVQLDVFQCPIRLYQGLLHNNATNIGLKMSQVLLPKIKIPSYDSSKLFERYGNKIDCKQISSTSLMRYLGVRATRQNKQSHAQGYGYEEYNALPLLAYWDIYKNYYSNKQEGKGYYITTKTGYAVLNGAQAFWGIALNNDVYQFDGAESYNNEFRNTQMDVKINLDNLRDTRLFLVLYKNKNIKDFTLSWTNIAPNGETTKGTWEYDSTTPEVGPIIGPLKGVQAMNAKAAYQKNAGIPNSEIAKDFDIEVYTISPMSVPSGGFGHDKTWITQFSPKQVSETVLQKNLQINDFDLTNIDDMRREILAKSNLNERLIIDHQSIEPYGDMSKVYAIENEYYSFNAEPMHGLGLKCYLSDLCNNWVNTEWIDGDNGVNALTAVSTADENFTIDSLLLHQKLWNVLLRIAVSGGTYEDWQEAVYGEEALRRAESPMYIGGLASEITFDEVVSTASAENAKGEPMALGSLGGRGTQSHIRGSEIEVEIKEPSYIIGIASITPRLDYSQGNAWDMEELDTLDDLHKPGLDVIGFQNLMQYTMCGWAEGAVGKQPAWINYMTSLNECHGEFAEENKAMFMTLNRRYENTFNRETGKYEISDLTTYINPEKYNYAFAYNKLEAQNFWLQIGCDIEARRKMSAKQIPNI